MKKFLVITLVLILTAVIWIDTYAQEKIEYKVIEVTDGGAIVGTVKFVGNVPAPKKLEVTKDHDVCASEPKFSEDLIVSKENKGIKNVVVSIKDIKQGKKLELLRIDPKSGKPIADNPVLDQKGCNFIPHIQIVPLEGNVEVLNNDGILHNIHTLAIKNKKALVNKGQPKYRKKMLLLNKERGEKFEFPEPIKVTCDAHPWMSGWIIVAEHPYYVLTDEKGEFKITDIPQGTYTLQYWHETLGKQIKEQIGVKAGAETKVDIEFKPKAK